MPRVMLAVALSGALAAPAAAQEAKPTGAALLQLSTQQDHRLMIEALGIESLREGANGSNSQAPNAANYDEAKVRAYTLPDPLTCKDGTKVATPEAWWGKPRPEIIEDFDREVYGRVPADVPGVRWAVVETKKERVGAVAAVTKRLVGQVDNARCPKIAVDIQLTLTTPAGTRGPGGRSR